MSWRKITTGSASDTNGYKPVYKRRKFDKRPPDVQQGLLFWPVAKKASGDEKSATEPAGAPDRSAAVSGEHRTAAAAGGVGPLFQSYGHCSDKQNQQEFPTEPGRVYDAESIGEVVGTAYLVRSCKCRRWFCHACGPGMGKQLRHRVDRRLQTFVSVFGITLTIDGKLFDSPEQAWLYFSINGLIGRFVRDLDRRGLLHSRAYFWVVEFQKETEQPHWHVLLDAGRIEHGVLVEIYSRYRPPHAPPLSEPITAKNYKGKQPAFGSVAFTPATSPWKAIAYATKYLCKFPKHGFPSWVLDRQGRLPRYNHSRGFFPRASNHDAMCFCEVCCGDAPAPAAIPKAGKKEAKEPTAAPKRQTTTIRERLERCEKTCSMVEVNRVRLPDGSVVDGRGRFVATLPITCRQACEVTGTSRDESGRLELDWEQADKLSRFATGRDVDGEAT